MTIKSKRKQLTDEEAVKSFEKAFEGVNFDEQPAQYFDEVLYDGTSTREALVRFQTNVQPRGEAALAPVPKAHEQQEPVAWINWSALTGERRLGWQCESELASEPLYAKPPTQHQKPLCTAAMFDDAFLAKSGLDQNTKLYTSPPASKPWVGLTEEERIELKMRYGNNPEAHANAIETRLMEKNS